jgi:hypothetical protein
LFFVLEQIETSSVLKCIYFFGSLWSDSTKNTFQKMSVYCIIQLCFVSNDIKTKGDPIINEQLPSLTCQQPQRKGFCLLDSYLCPFHHTEIVFFYFLSLFDHDLAVFELYLCLHAFKALNCKCGHVVFQQENTLWTINKSLKWNFNAGTWLQNEFK